MGVPNNRSHIRTSPVTISIRDLFSKINPKDIDFLKYVPNAFLNEDMLAVGEIESTADALEELAKTDRNLFQRIVDVIRDFIRVLRGQPQTKSLVKDLEYIEKRLARVYDSADTKKAAKKTKGEQFSIKSFKDGRQFVDVDVDQKRFDGLNDNELRREARKVIKEKFLGKVIGRNNQAYVKKNSAEEYAYPSKRIQDSDIIEAKMRASTELNNLLDAGENYRNESDGKDGHFHFEATGGFDYYDAIFKVGNKYYYGIVNIMVTKRGKVFKDLTKIEDITNDIIAQYGNNPQGDFVGTSSNDIILNEEDSVKNNISKGSENYSSDESFSIGSPMHEERGIYSKESRFIVDAIYENVNNIPQNDIFSVKSEAIPKDIKKSEYVLNIFKQQGKVANNSIIGEVELAQSGAKSTVFHGFGAGKLAATKAIKSVIENGTIVKKTENYNNSGVDRYVIAARGDIDNKPAYIGVIVKTYPNQKSEKAKFYLHEAIIVETDSPIMTAPQLSEDAVSESVTKNSIHKNEPTVNSKSMWESENYSSDESFSIGSPMQEIRGNLELYESGERTEYEYLLRDSLEKYESGEISREDFLKSIEDEYWNREIEWARSGAGQKGKIKAQNKERAEVKAEVRAEREEKATKQSNIEHIRIFLLTGK